MPGPAAQHGAVQPHAPQAPQSQADTSVNIAINDSKDFPSEVGALEDLYSELAMADGRVLFECPQLVKPTGIDLMNCPLNVVLKLRVRKRTLPGSMVLWHVILPLPLISKYLLNPPHEWETWIGLLPNTQSLDALPPEQLFTQSVHLISRPEYPKLRLRFTYHNPQLEAQLLAQREQQEQESRRRKELGEQVGRAQFENIHKLMRSVREQQPAGLEARPEAVAPAPAERSSSRPPPAAPPAPVAPPAASPPIVATNAGPSGAAGVAGVASSPLATTTVAQPVAEVRSNGIEVVPIVHSFVGLAAQVHHLLASEAGAGHDPGQPLPPQLDSEEVASGRVPAPVVDTHCQHLRRNLQLFHRGLRSRGAAEAALESQLVEGLRMALMGMIDDAPDAGARIPRTSTNLSASSNEQLASIQLRHPSLWEAVREVSGLARERASLLRQQQDYARRVEQLETECAVHRSTAERAVAAGSEKKHFEKLLNQQRQALQMGFDAETSALREKLKEREAEVAMLREQLLERGQRPVAQ